MSTVIVEFPTAAFAADAITRAAYVVMRTTDVAIEQVEEVWRCRLAPVGDTRADEDEVAAAFRREVVDQNLRLKLEVQTEPLRTAILGLAFSRAGLQGE